MNGWLKQALSVTIALWVIALSSAAFADGPVRIGNWQLAGSGAGDYPQASSINTNYALEFGGAANVTVTDFGQQVGWPSAAQLAQLDVLYITKFAQSGYTNPFTQANVDDLYNFVANGGHLVYVAESEGATGRTVRPLMSKFGLTIAGTGNRNANPRPSGQNAMSIGGLPNPSTTGSWEGYSGFPACHNVYGEVNWIVPGKSVGAGSVFLSGEVQDFSKNLLSSHVMIPKLAKLHDAYMYGTNADLFALDTTGLIDPNHVDFPCSNYTFPPAPFICGDGVAEGSEACDDGNTDAGDGCNTTCQIEANYTCPTAGGQCLTVDLVTPNDGLLTNMEPSITGTATPGATVTVRWIDDQGAVAHTDTVVADGMGAWSLPARGLSDGEFDVEASVTTTGGTISEQITFTLDRMPPNLTLSAPVNNSVTNDDTPNLAGQTEPGAGVVIEVIDGQNNSVFNNGPAVNGMGSFGVDSTSLADGTYIVRATATDAAGNDTVTSITFTVDTLPPAVALNTPADNSLSNDNTQTISGTAEPGAQLIIVVSDAMGATAFTAMATADAMGVWSVDSSALADGAYEAVVTATDAAGNVANDGPHAFVIDTTPPALSIATPAMGAQTADNTVTLSGAGEAGLTILVELRDAMGAVVATFMPTADAMGTWSVDTNALADGTYTVSATSSDAAGNMSSAGPVGFTVDTVAPAVALDAPANGTRTNDDTPTISGTTEPGAGVVIELTDVNGAVLQTLNPTVDAQGGFTVDAAQLPEGTYTVTATATDAAGNEAKDTVSFTIDTTAPGISINTPTDGELLNSREVLVSGASEANSTVVVELLDDQGVVVETTQTTTDANGLWSVTFQGVANGTYSAHATASDEAGNESDATVGFSVDSDEPNLSVTEPADGDITNETQPAITGTTDLDATVVISVKDDQGNTVFTTTVTPDANGDWSTQVDPALVDGSYLIEAVATRPNNKSTTVTVGFVVDTMAPDLTITQPAQGATTNDTTPTIGGATESGLEVVVTIKDAQGNTVFTGTALANAQGEWSVDTTELGEGEYTVEASTVDLAGNPTSAGPSTFTIDTTAAPITITSPQAGESVTDTTPTITGTADPNATVEIFVDGVKVGETVADAQGSWSFDTTEALDLGEHKVEAKTTDAAGNEGSSGEITFTVEKNKAPTTIVTPIDGNTIGGPEVTVTGTGEPGDTVTVTVGDKTQTVTVGDDGKWEVTFQDVPDGSTTITAQGDGDEKVEINVTVASSSGFLVTGGGCAQAPGKANQPSVMWLLLAMCFGAGLKRRRRA